MKDCGLGLETAFGKPVIWLAVPMLTWNKVETRAEAIFQKTFFFLLNSVHTAARNQLGRTATISPSRPTKQNERSEGRAGLNRRRGRFTFKWKLGLRAESTRVTFTKTVPVVKQKQVSCSFLNPHLSSFQWDQTLEEDQNTKRLKKIEEKGKASSMCIHKWHFQK